MGGAGLRETGLFDQASGVIRVLSAAPAALRPQLAAAAGNDVFSVRWTRVAPVSPSWHMPRSERERLHNLPEVPGRDILLFRSAYRQASARHDPTFGTAAYGLAIPIADGSWVVFALPERRWGLNIGAKSMLLVVFIGLSTAATSILSARGLVRPIAAFADAASRFGADPKAPPMVEQGPVELREAARAFNAMQIRVGRFVVDRTNMLAAISHDLRTPLTRIRLRGEFIDDPEQQGRLFRDVAEMQAMIDAALALFRDDADKEEPTNFDFSELVRLVVDDLTDQGKTASFDELSHVIYYGRPFALKRALENLFQNACGYGGSAAAWLDVDQGVLVLTLRDFGPGIPDDLHEAVFLPFYRVERSRNRQTGGVGLGLTSAQAIVREHGGDIVLSNHPEGGLIVRVTLPPDGLGSAPSHRIPGM